MDESIYVSQQEMLDVLDKVGVTALCTQGMLTISADGMTLTIADDEVGNYRVTEAAVVFGHYDYEVIIVPRRVDLDLRTLADPKHVAAVLSFGDGEPTVKEVNR